MTNELLDKAATYAVASDLSGIVETKDGFGVFPTRLAALGHQIRLLETERAQINEWLSVARRLRAREASTLARKRVLKWTQSRNGYTETHCGKYSIYPEYEGTTKPQSFRLWRNGDPRCNCGSHFNQRGAKVEAERLNAAVFSKESIDGV